MNKKIEMVNAVCAHFYSLDTMLARLSRLFAYDDKWATVLWDASESVRAARSDRTQTSSVV